MSSTMQGQLVIGAEVEAWDPWTPAEAAELLSNVDAPWYVAAGWAIDLFLGGQYRAHDDLEIGIADERFGELAEVLDPFDLYVPGQLDGADVAWLYGSSEVPADLHQTWVRDRSTRRWRLDIFREPSTGGRWESRRHPAITLDYDELILRTADGIPYARPEAVLLFKAKHQRPKDEADFAAALPHLDDVARSRLRAWLELVHPAHEWCEHLT